MRAGCALVAVVLIASGATIRGSGRPDRIQGTPAADAIDVVAGGPDTVGCGKGADVVTADGSDRIARDCETVSRRISFDTLTRAPGQHETEVEPSAFGWGSTVVATFQVGRHNEGGGAAATGWATSRDGGRTWRSGILPGVTAASRPPGEAERATDPVAAFDAAHGQWLVATLLSGRALSAIGISRSRDGVVWSAPVFAVHVPFATISFDKEWIACDNASTSRFFGSCYLAYTERNLFTPRLAFQSSRDGGLTWSEPTAATSAFGAGVVGALPVVSPDGTLTIVFDAGETGLYAVRSTDGGTTFAPPVSIASRAYAVQPFLRAPQLPAAAVDASGRLYVTWADCVFVAGCARNSVVVATSADGSTWSPPVRVPASGLDSFAPGIAAHPSIPGRVSVVTYVPSSGAYGVAVTSSRDGGATWTRPQRLDAVSPRYTWLAASEGGRFVGDYLGATYAGGRFVPVFTLAQPPRGGRFHEYTMAASLP